MKKHLFILIIYLCHYSLLSGQDKTNTRLDLNEQNDIITKLSQKSTRGRAINKVFKNPGHYNPAVFYQFADAQLARGEKNESIAWYLYAMMMARYDAGICNDTSARQKVALIESKFSPEFSSFMFKDSNLFKKSLNDAAQMVLLVNDDYDHRWICVYGENSPVLRPLPAPMEEWPDIKANTVASFIREYSRKKAK